MENLQHIIFYLCFCQSPFSFQQVVQSLNYGQRYFIRAKLEDDIDVQVVFKVVSELNNVGMSKTLMNFYLTHQLLLGPGFDEGALLDDFNGLHIFGLLGDEFIAACKAALAQKIPLDVTL